MKNFLVPISIKRVTGLDVPVGNTDAISKIYFEDVTGRSVTAGTISRTNGKITGVTLTGGDNIAITRDGNGDILSITKAGKMWTFTRINRLIVSWTVTPELGT